MDDPTIPSALVDDKSCQLLGPTALLVQAVMGVIVLLSLVYKRHREIPKRPWRIWSFDVSKQVAGQLIVHALNVGLSALVSQPDSGHNPCTAYFMNVTFDVTLGVVIIWTVLHGVTNLLTERFHFTGFQSGSYGTPPSVRFWAQQTAVYIFSLVCMKLVVLFILATFPSVFHAGDWLLSWTGGNEHVQVVFVMGLYPIVMNILQFWLIDSIVKASASLLESTEGRDDRLEADRRPLVHAEDDSDYSDTEGFLRTPGSDDIERQKPPSFLNSSGSRPKSIHSRSPSEARSIHSSKSERIKRTKARPLPLDTHDYPPSRQQSPEPSSSNHRKSSVPKQSPPPSPSPLTTPNGYGSTIDSPRLRAQEGNKHPQGWEWEEDPDEIKTKLARSLTPPISHSSPKAPPRKESWNMPTLQPPTQARGDIPSSQ